MLIEAGQELLLLRPDFKWNRASYSISIRSDGDFEALAVKHVFLLIASHCTTYYPTMMASSVVTSSY